MPAKLETELKFPLPRPAALRRRLRELGFTIHKPRTREQNWIFGKSQGNLLRLRRTGRRWLLTAKGPRLPGPLKRRREIEIEAPNGPALLKILTLALGVTVTYDRHRTVFTRARQPGEIAWDETPFGVYLEIEGAAAWVRRTAAQLGLSVADAEPRSYPEIYATAHPPKARTR
ncbi:MAG TPA: CYTH domain-containing protein [Terriglobales bacterium]|nr:CYTH domain-containing protein [Terriglobales bacterium]